MFGDNVVQYKLSITVSMKIFRCVVTLPLYSRTGLPSCFQIIKFKIGIFVCFFSLLCFVGFFLYILQMCHFKNLYASYSYFLFQKIKQERNLESEGKWKSECYEWRINSTALPPPLREEMGGSQSRPRVTLKPKHSQLRSINMQNSLHTFSAIGLPQRLEN